MPTPVSTARQCLAPEAAQAFDEAVLVGRRRGHAQTTSLHMVSALLHPSSSALREACARTRNNAYSSRVQFRALELCLGLSLDRLPSSPQKIDEPPISNSLMAAIKRSQANQRRQPENFQFYQQQSQSSSSSISMVKVELQNLILSILDDPVVSRVFGEAGFRSCDIKLSILRPIHQMFRYSRYKAPPMFLCNLASDSGLDGRGFTFPFPGFSGFFGGSGGGNCRRIGEILGRIKGRNPLLVGVSAIDALRNFIEIVQSTGGGEILPVELSGLSVISVQNEVSNFVSNNSDEGFVKSSFEEVGRRVELCIGPGVVVNFGDINPLISNDDAVNAARHVITELARLLELHGRKVWLIGATAKYETYLKFLNRFPSIEKDLDLQLLPMSSLREPYPRSSLMESFVPLGGFFSTPSDTKCPSNQPYQCASRCRLCNEKFDQEVTALSNGLVTASVADHCQSSLPSWLQLSAFNTDNGLDVVKAKDDSISLSAKVAALEKKWDNICHHLHYTHPLPKANTYQVGPQVPSVFGFQVAKEGKTCVGNRENTNPSSNESGSKITNSSVADPQQISSSKASSPFKMVLKPTDADFLSKLHEKPPKTEELGSFRSPPHSLSISSAGDGRASSTSATSVTTDLDLGLGMYSSSPRRPNHQRNMDLAQDFSTNVDAVAKSTSYHPAQSSSCSCSEFQGHFDQKDSKTIYAALAKRVSWQQEAARVISNVIFCRRTRKENRPGINRGDIWFNFVGPDRLGKKKIAMTLAEVLYGSREQYVCIDLSFQPLSVNGYDIKFRGKTIIDYIVQELSKKPLSVVVLENIHKADLVAQNSLSLAMRTGRFSDSHGREVGIGNAIFVATSGSSEDGQAPNSDNQTVDYCKEESILKAKFSPIQILIGLDLGDRVRSHTSRVPSTTRNAGSDAVFVNKRKLTGTDDSAEQNKTKEIAKRAHKAYLDLNLPAEDGQMISMTGCGSSDSETSRAWLEDFIRQVDETVIFKPFDFDSLAVKMLEVISECFRANAGSECVLEIDSNVLDQIVAAAYWSSIGKVKEWVQQVLSKGFEQAQERRSKLTACSVLKLIPCCCDGGLFPQDQTPGAFLLPSTITLN